MSQVALFKIDPYGYPRFTNSGFMSREDATKMLAVDADFVGCEALTYGEYKTRMDPDDMSEAELRRRFGAKTEAPKARVAVLTGTFPGMTRSELKEVLLAKGYRVASKISAATTLLVCGEAAGSKLADAMGRGIPVARTLNDIV